MHAPASVCRMSDLEGELDALASGTGFSGVVRIDQSDRIELARKPRALLGVVERRNVAHKN